MTLSSGTQYEIKCHPSSWVLCNKFIRLEILLQIFLKTCKANSRTKSCISESYYDNPHSVYLCPTSPRPPPHPRRHQPGQLVYDLTLAPDVDLSNDNQTNIHWTMFLDMTAPPTTNTLNQCAITSPSPLPRIKSLCKQGTGDDLTSIQ